MHIGRHPLHGAIVCILRTQCSPCPILKLKEIQSNIGDRYGTAPPGKSGTASGPWHDSGWKWEFLGGPSVRFPHSPTLDQMPAAQQTSPLCCLPQMCLLLLLAGRCSTSGDRGVGVPIKIVSDFTTLRVMILRVLGLNDTNNR